MPGTPNRAVDVQTLGIELLLLVDEAVNASDRFFINKIDENICINLMLIHVSDGGS